MRRVIIALLILILPSATAVIIYLVVNKRVPTSRDAIGHVSTIAGSGAPGFEDGPAHSVRFSDPFGIAVDRRGNLYVTDAGQNNRIRRINTDGKVDTIAGSVEGFADGPASQAQFNTPSGIAIDKSGNIIIADTSNNRVRRIAPDGKVTTLAGSVARGLKDGPASEAEFDGPIGVAVDLHGNVLVTDAYNDCIRRISTDGNVSTIAGTGTPGFADGEARSASFDTPSGISLDNEENIFVADTGNHAVRKIDGQGNVSTIVATSTETRLNRPVGLAITHDGFIFVSDEARGAIVRITPDGIAESYAGSNPGYADGNGERARFNGPTGMAIDREGNLFVADSENYTIRQVSPLISNRSPEDQDEGFFVQPPQNGEEVLAGKIVPKLSVDEIAPQRSFPWPLSPQDQWHEIAGVVGEARGAPGGVALDHLHSGLDIHGQAGEAALSVYDEKVSSPIPNWDFGGGGEGIHIGLFSYIHIRVARYATDATQSEKFKVRTNGDGKQIGVRVRRGTRFRVGDFIGSLNRMNHVHLNLGPWNAQANPLALPLIVFRDSVAPTVEKIEVFPAGAPLASAAPQPRLVKDSLTLSGDVAIVVTAYDRVDGNVPNRKLGLYRVGYQVLNLDGTPAAGFEQPLMNLEFNRLPPDDAAVLKAYAAGSGVSAYGTPTKFRYIVTNLVRDGEAKAGLLRTSALPNGDYIIRVIAEDFAGNRASGDSTELRVTVRN